MAIGAETEAPESSRSVPRHQPASWSELRRNPNNPVDPNAVEVYRRSHQLGHLARTNHRIISRLFDRGMKLRAKIQALRHSKNPG